MTALAGAALAWAHELPWVAAACLAIGVGELLESSYYLSVLAWGERRDYCRRNSRPDHLPAAQ